MGEEELEILRDESYRRSAWDDQIQQSNLNVVVEKEELNLFVTLGLKLKKNGNRWCVLYGDNLQEGISGFGDTPMKAIWDFNKSFYKIIVEENSDDR